ncbi:MAG: hypothetical protein LPK03_09200, partial [Pontibacter sp.]|nr:hypothetical protein [Pontibacter sp.]
MARCCCQLIFSSSVATTVSNYSQKAISLARAVYGMSFITQTTGNGAFLGNLVAMDEQLLSIPTSKLATLPLPEVRSHLLDLFCQGAYQEGDFTLSSGQRSTYYINGKLVTLHPQGALMVGRLLLDRLSPDVVGVAGLTLGADPIVTAVSLVGAYCDRALFPL